MLEFTTRAKSVPMNDEFPDGLGDHGIGQGVTRLHVARFEKSVRVWHMRGCRMCAVGHHSLEIGAIIMVLSPLRDGDAIESDVTLSEQRVEEIIGP